MRVALVVGHRNGAPGAVAADGMREYDYVDELAQMLAARLDCHEVRVFWRSDDDDGRSEPARIRAMVETHVNPWVPDLVVSLHVNAAEDPRALGAEALHHPGSERGQEAARVLASLMAHACDTRNRGAKPRDGLPILAETAAPAVLLEPFFLSNPADLDRGRRYKPLLADAIAHGVHVLGARWGV